MKPCHYTAYYNSPFGCLHLASDGINLIGLWFEKQKHYAETLSENVQENASLPIFKKTKDWLDDYFKKQNPKIENLPLAPWGSGFRQQVWEILSKVPSGQVVTYGDIARKITEISGKPVSAQAVGGAVGHNPLSIIIPCHRVVGAQGCLTGYAAGLEVKIKLLTLENIGFVDDNHVDIKKYCWNG